MDEQEYQHQLKRLETEKQRAAMVPMPTHVSETKAIGRNDPWTNRSAGMKCITCMWFAQKTIEIGRCRRHAPSMGGYPVVKFNDWCGDHRLDETK